MMSCKLFRLTVCVLCVCILLLSAGMSASAAADTEKFLLGISPREIGESYDYLNESTQNRVCVIDEEGLLQNRQYLVELLKPLTDYGTAIFWSCSVSADEQQKQVDEWQDGEYAKDSFVIVMNMQEEVYHLYSSGAVFRAIPKDSLQAISDELKSPVSRGDYDAAAKTGFMLAYRELSGEELAEPPTEPPVADGEAVRYTNPDTGYQAMILDDADLLTEGQESALADAMQPITAYGHIVFWSTNEKTSDAEIQARQKRYSYYGYDSAGILAINMANRKVVFHADGAMYSAVSASDARSITDNVSGYASTGDYYTCAAEAFRQVQLRLQGQAIAEPMKYTSYTMIALMLAFVIVVGLAFGRLNPLSKQNREPAKFVGTGKLLANEPLIRRTGTRQRAWVTVLWILISSLGPGGEGGGSSGGSSGGGGGSSGGGGGGSSSF